jgi:hypothetical protein
MSPPSWYQESLKKTSKELIVELTNQLQKYDSFVNDRKGLNLAIGYERFRLSSVLANLRTTYCCFDCQLRLVEQREESERTIQALQMRLDLLDVKLYNIQEKITFLDCCIPRLIEMEHDMFLYDLSLLDLACR